MNWDRDKATRAFKEEAYELLSDLEAALLELEKTPEDEELVGSVFRALHTLKGTGSMFGFDDIAGIVHEAETVFDLIRGGRLSATKEIIDLSLSMRDRILAMLDEGQAAGHPAGAEQDPVGQAFRKILEDAGISKSASNAAAGVENEKRSSGGTVTYRIYFRPPKDIFLTGTSPIGLINELRTLGRCTVVARTGEIPPLGEIDPEFCYTYWDAILTTNRGKKEIEDVFIFVEHDSEVNIEAIHRGSDLDSEECHRELGTLLASSTDIADEDIVETLSSMAITASTEDEEKSAATGPGTPEQASNGRGISEALSSIRVPSGKLDKLVDLVGELVTTQARLTQATSTRGDAELQVIAEEVERLTEELRDNAMSLRMVPIGPTFKSFRRLVRDLSRELGKEVDLITDGEETELDKKMIEKINEPLVHIIRNAIDHGIESPNARKAAGKKKVGTIHLSAAHTGAYMYIRIKDDGAGFDPSAIRQKAIEKGLIPEDAEISEEEVKSFAFMPGFTTTEGVSSVSGRGVGLDVVKMRVEALKGIVEVESEQGIGTTITLKLPLTLAIIEGLLVHLGQEQFVIPLSTVEECVELTRRDIDKTNGRCMLNVRGEVVPYINLRNHFRLAGDPPPIEQVVITRAEHGRIGFVVDSVVGELQTVIKSLGRFYRDIEGISGATILGDGRVALILDVPKLIKSAAKAEAEKNRQGG